MTKEYKFQYIDLEKTVEAKLDENGEFVLKKEPQFIVIGWGAKDFGFGDLIISSDKDGKIHIDTETLGKDFAKQLLNHLIDEAILDG